MHSLLFRSLPTASAFHLQVIFQKYRISYDEIVNDLCPVTTPVLSLSLSHAHARVLHVLALYLYVCACMRKHVHEHPFMFVCAFLPVSHGSHVHADYFLSADP